MKMTTKDAARFLALAVLAGGLAACASAADPAAMVVNAPPPGDKPFPAPLEHAMCVRNVTGGEATNPMWVSKVDNAGFHTALDTSLNNAGLAASSAEGCHFPIDVNLLGLSQPIAGFDMTVTSHVNYKVYDSAGAPLLLETIDAPYTAAFSEAFAGVERLKKANEGSVRESIHKFFDKLRDTTPK
jgi:hypothetical protein